MAVDDRFDAADGRAAVQALQQRIANGPDPAAPDADRAAHILSLATDTAEAADELLAVRADSGAAISRFIGLRIRLDDILDEEIQILARRGLDDAFALRQEAERSTMAIFSYLSLAVIGIAFVGGTLHIRGVATPMARLADAAQAIGNGDLEVRTGLRRGDEIGVLSRSFDEMADALQAMRQRNDRINAELEDTVARRTEDLRATNLKLLSELEQKAHAEEELRQVSSQAKRANKAKSTFLANMSHELRTPLNAILGFSEMIEGEMLGQINNKQYQEYASLISESGRHLLQIIDDLLDLSRIEAGRFDLTLAPTDMAASIDQTVRLLRPIARSRDITMEPLIQSSLSPLLADRRRIDQILMNLVGNAIKFTQPQGRIVIRARQRRTTPAGMDITVFDTGVGIPERELARVLDRFGRRTHDTARTGEGAGLGLAVTKGLVDMHDGRLTISSQEGCGTAATVWFPSDRILPQDALSAGPSSDRQGRRPELVSS